MTAAMVAVTASLGFWQVQRLAWKRGLLAQIDRGETEAPLPLTEAPPAFRRVIVEGRFLPLVARYGVESRITPAGPALGARLISPLDRPGQAPILVDRGWAPSEFDPMPPGGPVRITGYVRPPDRPTWFSPADDLAGRRFYTLAPGAIGTGLGLAAVAPFTLVALGPATGLPQPAASLPRPANNHLVYAITWFGLAATLVFMFAAYARQTLREHRTR